MAAAVSKTSFALTLLRISSGWVKCIVWFAMLTVNVVMGLSILFNWISCSPVEKTFNVLTPGTCWPKTILIGYNSFVAGMEFSFEKTTLSSNVCIASLFRSYGHSIGAAAVEDHLEDEYEQEGALWSDLRHEPGISVKLHPFIWIWY